MLFVWEEMFKAFRNLQETLLTKHVISSKNRIDLTETIYDENKETRDCLHTCGLKLRPQRLTF
jgi:hypothetical protein